MSYKLQAHNKAKIALMLFKVVDIRLENKSIKIYTITELYNQQGVQNQKF